MYIVYNSDIPAHRCIIYARTYVMYYISYRMGLGIRFLGRKWKTVSRAAASELLSAVTRVAADIDTAGCRDSYSFITMYGVMANNILKV